MANIKVLTSGGNCNCDCDDAQTSSDVRDLIVVRHQPGTVTGNAIAAYNENGKKVYELQDLALIAPQVSFSNSAPSVVEVGRTLESVNFEGSISAGTFPIAARSIAPDPGGLDLTEPFSFTKTNVYRSSPGVAQQHTLSATDDQSNSKSVTRGVTYKHAFYRGYNPSASLTQVQIKALADKTLVDGILSSYGGVKQYVIPGSVAQYVYWCGVIGQGDTIQGASLNGFALPLVSLDPVLVTNIWDALLGISYWVKRTANKIDPGTYSIGLS